VLASLVGCVGGIYGAWGGSILAPVLIGSGRPAAVVAAAWTTGVALGIGGLAGAYTGARIRRRRPVICGQG
jgi:uncharacterized membrane protein YfcA